MTKQVSNFGRLNFQHARSPRQVWTGLHLKLLTQYLFATRLVQTVPNATLFPNLCFQMFPLPFLFPLYTFLLTFFRFKNILTSSVTIILMCLCFHPRFRLYKIVMILQIEQFRVGLIVLSTQRCKKSLSVQFYRTRPPAYIKFHYIAFNKTYTTLSQSFLPTRALMYSKKKSFGYHGLLSKKTGVFFHILRYITFVHKTQFVCDICLEPFLVHSYKCFLH